MAFPAKGLKLDGDDLLLLVELSQWPSLLRD